MTTDDDLPAFQELYADPWSHCYGCGRLNDHGLHIRSHWDGDHTVAVVRPRPYHTALPGFVYGGLIASAIDCHSTGSAAAAQHRDQGRPDGLGPLPRFVTGRLEVDFLSPTSIDETMILRGTIESIDGRKVTVATEVACAGEITATGRAILIQVPDEWEPSSSGGDV